jgi:hypothetical protein
MKGTLHPDCALAEKTYPEEWARLARPSLSARCHEAGSGMALSDPGEGRVGQLPVLVVGAEVTQPLHAHQPLVRQKPVEHFVEEPRIVSSCLKREEQEPRDQPPSGPGAR